MTRPTTTDLAITDRCIRCDSGPSVQPEDKVRTLTGSVVLTYHCEAGHAWTRTLTRGAIKRKTATAGPRLHIANRPTTTTAPTTTTTTPDHEDDCTDRTRTGRQPGPATGWHPDRRLWLPR
jgi:hypothetical protein